MDGGGTELRKVTRKGKVNGSKVSNAFSKMGTMVLNVLHE